MSDFETKENAREEPAQTLAAPDSSDTVAPSAAAVGRTLVVGVLLALAGAWIASTLADRFRILEVVEQGARVRGAFEGRRLVVGNAAQNAAVAYALLGAMLSLSLAISAGCLPRRPSLHRILPAGLAGIALGGVFGAASAYVLTPLYLNRLDTADVTLSVLIHAGIWSATGAAAGIAFGIGLGTKKALTGSLIGGITSGGSGGVLFDICGAFLPLAHTERPLSEEAGTRLAAAALLSVLVAIGTVIVAIQEPKKKTGRRSSPARLANDTAIG